MRLIIDILDPHGTPAPLPLETN